MGGAGAEKVGLAVGVGTITLGAGAATVAAGGGEALTVGTGGAAGVAATGGRAAGAATLTGACCLRMAFRTSPGREILERSILVLISSLSTRLERACFVEVCASLMERKYARTFSASCSSTELECVFFSVTPTSGSASRIALLLTSSSLARSLIRILLIRLFFPPEFPAKSSYQPHGVGFPLHASTIAESATLSLLFAFGRSRLVRRFFRLLFGCLCCLSGLDHGGKLRRLICRRIARSCLFGNQSFR